MKPLLTRPSLKLIWFSAVLVMAQSGSSTISGTLKDPAGSSVPKAKIKIVNEQTGVSLDTETNEAGLYRAGSLVPGIYTIDVEAEGFQKLVHRSVAVEVGQIVALDLTLELGKSSETVTVTEATPLTESQSSTLSQAVNRQMLAGLPLPNRAASSLAALAPGVIMIDTGSGTAENYPLFSVAGGRARNQNFILDGGSVNNAVGLNRPSQMTTLPVDAMQEFRVIANNYSAEYGHSTGGVVSMSTRSGTNQYHGSLFESLQNTSLNARNFFAETRPASRLNQFGASFGGPLRKDKTHFFVTWERTIQLTSDTIKSTVPTLLNRAGDFSDLRNSAGNPVLIYDPATTVGSSRHPFPNNKISLERFDRVAVAALSYLPLPNVTGTITNANNFVGSSANTLNRDIVVGRLDHQFRASDVVTARYYINDASTNGRGTYGIPISDPLADLNDVRVQSILGAHTHIFAPALANTVSYSYLRRKFIDLRPGAGSNLAMKIGLTGVSAASFPAFTIPGYGVPSGIASGTIAIPTTGATLGNPASVGRIQTPIGDHQILDSLAWNRGTHALKFGVELRLGSNDESRDRGSSGNLTFTPLITDLPGVSGTGNAFASFLLGEVNAGSVQASDTIPSRAQYLGLYAQDDWRVSNRLTINAGLRWEAEFPRRVVGNKMNSFDPIAINPVSGTPGVVTFAGVNGTPERAFATDTNNFGPRVGFAYRIPGKRETVIRGGAGVMYSTTISNSVGDLASLGFSASASYTVAQAEFQSALRLREGFPAFAQAPLTAAFGAVPVGQRVNTSVPFFNPLQVAPISYQYNLDIQREVVRDLLLEVGYIGNTSHHLTANDLTGCGKMRIDKRNFLSGWPV